MRNIQTAHIQNSKTLQGYIFRYDNILPPNFAILLIARLLSGKNWQDRDKADKVSIFFPRDF